MNGKPVRVRDALNSSGESSSNEILPPSSKPINAYNYGEFLPLQKITDELKIGEYLGDLFNEKDRNMIFSMSFNRVVRPYDPKREMEEKSAFYSRLYDVKEKLEETAIPGWRNAAEIFKERAREMASLCSWEKIDDHFRINIKKNAVTQRINRMGKFFLFYYRERDWMECLTLYREMDVVEKGFKIMKNDIQSLPLSNCHKID